MTMRNQDGTEVPAFSLTGTEDDLAYLLGDTYICTRVWEAWEVGTMTEEDFTPADTPDVRAELIAWRDAAVAAERARIRKRFEQECEGDLYAEVADLFDPDTRRVSMEEATRMVGELPDPIHHHDVFSRIEASAHREPTP